MQDNIADKLYALTSLVELHYGVTFSAVLDGGYHYDASDSTVTLQLLQGIDPILTGLRDLSRMMHEAADGAWSATPMYSLAEDTLDLLLDLTLTRVLDQNEFNLNKQTWIGKAYYGIKRLQRSYEIIEESWGG